MKYEVLDTTNIKSIKEGRKVVDLIDDLIREKNLRLRQAGEKQDNAAFNKLTDEHYQLIKMKRSVQNQMAKFVKVGK